MGIIGFIFIVIVALILLIAIFFKDEIESTRDRDPAATSYLQIVLLYAGLHAIVAYRISSILWKYKIPLLPRFISQLARFFTGIEIHPGANIGKGLFIDHGTGVVVGETTIIGNNVTLFQGVTLGGTGKETGKRHPTLGDNIVVGAGAKVLGDIEIGSNSYIGANAVVIKSVPESSTVVGVPGRITKQDGQKIDTSLNHMKILDPVVQQIEDLKAQLKCLQENQKCENEDL